MTRTLAMLAVLFPLQAFAQAVPWERLPNVEQGKLTDDVKTRATRVMQQESCYAECDGTIFACVTAGSPTATALHAAGFLVREVIRGKSDADIRKDLSDRARSLHPLKPAAIPLEGTPLVGDPNAKVKVVIFADFDCPFCRQVSPMLRSMIPAMAGVAFYFKVFPVKAHGEIAIATSKAGIAADRMGKFWEFHDVMYRNFDAHSEGEVEGYAAALGIDLDAFRSFRDSREAEDAVAASKREGLKLGVKSTPTIFINGKEYFGEKSEIELKDVIQEELDISR